MRADFRVGRWLVTPSLNHLSCGERVVRLEPKVMDVLLRLADDGEVVSKDELIRSVWEGAFVGDDVITRSISELRKAFDDDPKRPEYIETIPKRGYRLLVKVSAVTAIPEEALESPASTGSRRVTAIAVAAAIAVLVAAIGSYVALRRPSAGPIRSIAVLPLANLSGDANQEYLSEGMTEELIASLTQIHSLRVIPRTSVAAYKSTKKSLPEIGRELGVDAVVEGSVLPSGQRVRISARLVQCATNTTMWAEEYERDLKDVLGLQAEVARSIVKRIDVTVAPAEQQRLTPRPVNAEAYQFYLKGRHQLDQRLVEKAAANFSEAIRLEPNYARAYAGLADSYSLSMYGEMRPEQAASKAKEAAQHALQLDDSNAEAHASLGWEMLTYEWDRPGAEREFQRAIELDRGFDWAHMWYGCALVWSGEFDRGLAELKLGRELAPTSNVTNFSYGMGLMDARRYDEAIAELKAAIEIAPTNSGAHVFLGLTYVAKNMPNEGVAEIEKQMGIRRLTETVPAGPLSRLAYAYARAGRKQDALAILRQLREKAKIGYVPSMAFVVIYTGLGDREHAFYWLHKSVEERGWEVAMIKVDPRFDSLHGDPRFAEALRQAHLGN